MASLNSALYRKKSGGTMSRFLGTSHHADEAQASLSADHPAVVNGTTLFPKSVKAPAESPQLLVSGVNNAKTGDRIVKGPWAGCKIFTLSLVERETCPRSCATWQSCYGNAMNLARRHRPDDDLMPKLEVEIGRLIAEHGKIAVRLHVLGDFYSKDYAMFWGLMLGEHKGLHIWGYTGRYNATSDDYWIARVIETMNGRYSDRCAIRFSNARHPELTAGIIWRQPEGPVVAEGTVCPASREATAACGTCGMCWAPEMRDKRIIFVGHGAQFRRKKSTTSKED